MWFLLFQIQACESPEGHLTACVTVTARVVPARPLTAHLSARRYLMRYKGTHHKSTGLGPWTAEVECS